MSHELEERDGKTSMAYSGETPWHGLGVNVPADLTPEQMLESAGLNWTVEKRRGFYFDNDEYKPMKTCALLRSVEPKELAEVPEDWEPVQNLTAFEFFNDWVAEGSMSMETAGSLNGGRIVWGLARVKDSITLFKGKDVINPYMLFTNYHKYGFSTSVSLTAIRVVCSNTIKLSLGTTTSDKIIRVSHRNIFNPDEVKETMGIAKKQLEKYKEAAMFLSSKKAKDEDIVTYFKRVFPVLTSKPKEEKSKDLSKNAKICMDLLNTQPGADLGQGTYWALINDVTYYIDHHASRSQDTRLTSAWYGQGAKKKQQAMDIALEMAEAS